MEPSSKRSRITDFFQKLPSNPAISMPEYPAFLRRFRPIDALRCPRSRVRPCRSSPKLQAASTDEASMPPAGDENNSTATNQRGTYKSYSLHKKLEVVAYRREHSETEASRQFGVPRSTIYGWRNLDKEPIEKSQKKGKFPMSKKGKLMKKGAGRPISYKQEIEDELITWVLRQRDLQIPVRRQDIQLKAMELISPDNPSFKASNGWMNKFMRRHSLSLRWDFVTVHIVYYSCIFFLLILQSKD